MTAVPSFGPWRQDFRAASGGDTNPYSDRARAPEDTFAHVASALPGLGITRVAKQTGLDRIGIPVYAALRPNALTLASSQGKGIDDSAARTSATMEAIEFAFAEKPRVDVVVAKATGNPVFDVTGFLPIGTSLDADAPVRFTTGTLLWSGRSVLVPYDLVDLDETASEIANLNRSSNGLASGNTREEAILHGLLELIERDATTLAALMGGTARFGRPIVPQSLADPMVDRLVDQIEAAGFEFWIFDQTTDIGVPVFQAVIGDPSRNYWRHFDLATGYGCHPNAARAAIRAVTEAAQTRVTNIAGARDDFWPAEYRLEAYADLVMVLREHPPGHQPPPGVGLGLSTSTLMGVTLEALQRAGCEEPLAVHLGGEELGIAVTRVFSADLEDRSTNRHWRPGRRALRAMLV
jgi:ribosomal protein S12 methylthiotransferase accessory factor